MFKRSVLAVLAVLACAAPAWAGKADVVGVDVKRAADGKLDFAVTVHHDDEGWQHYADRWEIVGPDGKVLATRVLQHPHVGEQPFTRSLDEVVVPGGVEKVTVRAHDSVHGYGGKEMSVEIPR
jgi:hypothetical protein